MKFTQYLLSYLKQAGITKIFGVPGREGEYIRFNETPGIEYISTHLEFNGGLIADYLARITQTVQVCFCTLGPGATTAFTPLASSRLNFSPTIFIFAQVEHNNVFYNLTHQCVDQVSMAQPLAKWAYELKSPEELIDVLDVHILSLKIMMVILHYKSSGRIVQIVVLEKVFGGETGCMISFQQMTLFHKISYKLLSKNHYIV